MTKELRRFWPPRLQIFLINYFRGSHGWAMNLAQRPVARVEVDHEMSMHRGWELTGKLEKEK